MHNLVVQVQRLHHFEYYHMIIADELAKLEHLQRFKQLVTVMTSFMSLLNDDMALATLQANSSHTVSMD